MRVVYEEYGMVLKKFVAHIEANEIIMEYIYSGQEDEFDIKKEWDLVVKDDYMFSLIMMEKLI